MADHASGQTPINFRDFRDWGNYATAQTITNLRDFRDFTAWADYASGHTLINLRDFRHKEFGATMAGMVGQAVHSCPKL